MKKASAQEIFGSRVRQERRDQGYSQERFAAACGIDRSYMGQIERGEKNATLKTILRISDTLEINPGVLVDGLQGDDDRRSLNVRSPSGP